MRAIRAASALASWNPPSSERLAQVRVEDDVREALQNVRVHRPTLPQRRQMLDLSARVGVQVTFLGFPAAGAGERDQCAALIDHISDQNLPLTPVLMARALPADLRAILDIQQKASIPVTADIYLSTSPIRAMVEGWNLAAMLGRLTQITSLASAEGLAFRIAFEDSTRTPPADLAAALKVALSIGAQCVVLNDTAGDCLPAGAASHVEFAAGLIKESGADVELAWHGHNDKGLALANSLAAIESGATLISGTFTGLGERTGNLALEQLITILAGEGDTRYDLSQLVSMCDLVADSTHVTIPEHLPIVGADAFSTSTGTHATALIKARALGPEFEDAIYSAVRAAPLGRRQELLLGPNSGRAQVSAVLTGLQRSNDGATVDALLAYCKKHDRTLRTPQDVFKALAANATYPSPSAPAGPSRAPGRPGEQSGGPA